MKEICPENKCTGCCTCYNICSKQCITMKEDKLGYMRPEINTEKCIDCGLCIKICPANNDSDFRMPKEVYAIWNLDEADREDSASGGAATVFERNILKQGGVIFASRFNDKLDLFNDAAESEEEIQMMKGSKYVQSYIGKAYTKIKENLEKNKKVIFIGTPCQVDGLNFFLKKKYENLITVDFVCHGVPPIRYLKEHIAAINKKINKNITDVKFRGKNEWKISLYSKDKLVYLKDCNEDVYYRGFSRGLYDRECCYSCKYATVKRVSDLTIGDFWNLDDLNLDEQGVKRASLVMVNTKKGEEFFEECSRNMFYAKRSIDEAVSKQRQLRGPSEKNEKIVKFRDDYIKYGFERAANRCLRIEIIYYKIKSKIKRFLGLFIKKYRSK